MQILSAEDDDWSCEDKEMRLEDENGFLSEGSFSTTWPQKRQRMGGCQNQSKQKANSATGGFAHQEEKGQPGFDANLPPPK